jgi:hypothetical protein
MTPSAANDAVRGGGTALQAVQIIQIAPMHLGARGRERVAGRL